MQSCAEERSGVCKCSLDTEVLSSIYLQCTSQQETLSFPHSRYVYNLPHPGEQATVFVLLQARSLQSNHQNCIAGEGAGEEVLHVVKQGLNIQWSKTRSAWLIVPSRLQQACLPRAG